MRKLFCLIFLLAAATAAVAQSSTVQNRPYTDLRPFHFGVVVGMHTQDIEFSNIGPQIVMNEDGTSAEKIITCDQDTWDLGFTVGVLGEARISEYLAFRLAPAMYFGNRHLMFMNLTDRLENGEPVTERQDMKSIYISTAMNLLFSAKRLNNVRPYIMAGINPMLNLSGKDSDYIKLKKYDVFAEVGLGCDFYLPYFKLRPELKFCYGLINSLDTKHPDQLRDQNMVMYARSVKDARSKMIVLSFYFE